MLVSPRHRRDSFRIRVYFQRVRAELAPRSARALRIKSMSTSRPSSSTGSTRVGVGSASDRSARARATRSSSSLETTQRAPVDDGRRRRRPTRRLRFEAPGSNRRKSSWQRRRGPRRDGCPHACSAARRFNRQRGAARRFTPSQTSVIDAVVIDAGTPTTPVTRERKRPRRRAS